MDQDVSDAARLDAVVTVADAKWLSDRLKDAPEAKNQIAFADVIILNKIDLVSPRRTATRSKARIRAINPYAKLHRTQNCADPDRARCSTATPSISTASWRSSRDFLEEGHHHHHDEDDADPSPCSMRRRGEPGKVHAVDLEPDPGRGAEHPALQGHRGLPGRAEALRLPGRPHDPRRRRAAAMEAGREARTRGWSSSAAT